MAQIRTLISVVKCFKNWPTHVLDYLRLLSPRKIHYRLRDGAQFYARAKTLDSMVIREIFINNDYSPVGFEIPKTGVIVDVGGHIGCFSIFAARKSPAARIFTLEPTPESFSMLRENLELNAVRNVVPLNMALLEKSGERELSMCANQVSHSFVFGESGSDHIKVHGISFADLMNEQKIEQVDFLKMDCEGAEFEILFNLPPDILAKIKMIVAEIHHMDDARSRASLAKYLREHGFEVVEDPIKVWMLYARRV